MRTHRCTSRPGAAAAGAGPESLHTGQASRAMRGREVTGVQDLAGHRLAARLAANHEGGLLPHQLFRTSLTGQLRALGEGCRCGACPLGPRATEISCHRQPPRAAHRAGRRRAPKGGAGPAHQGPRAAEPRRQPAATGGHTPVRFRAAASHRGPPLKKTIRETKIGADLRSSSCLCANEKQLLFQCA